MYPTSILFTNARDEQNILEWVVHHRNLGFDKIVIYDHKSVKPIKNILRKVPFVDVIRVDSDKILKEQHLRNACAYAKRQRFHWMLYLDADEFLILNNTDNVKKCLKQVGPMVDQIGVNWLMFGSNYKDLTNGGILENYIRSDGKLNQHIKSFLRIKYIALDDIKNYNPHVYMMKDMSKSYNIDGGRYTKDTPFFYETSKKFDQVGMFVAHYVYQSYDVYIGRKIARPRDGTGTFRNVIPKDEFHKCHNDLHNTYVFDKYNKKNHYEMKKYI